MGRNLSGKAGALFVLSRNEYKKESLSADFSRVFKKTFPGIRVECLTPATIDGEHWVRHEFAKRETDVALINLRSTIDFQKLAEASSLTPLDGWISPALRQELAPIGLAKYTHQGKLYALPKNLTLGLFYGRRDLLDRYGFDLPATWRELTHQAKEITRREKGLVGFGFRGRGGLARTFIEYLWSNGGKIFHRGEPAVASPEAEETLDFFLRMIYSEQLVPAAYLEQGPWRPATDFKENRLLFLQDSSDMLLQFEKRFRSRLEAKLKFSPAPLGPSGKNRAAYPDGSYFAVPASTRRPEAARALVRFFTDESKSGPFCQKWFFPFSPFRFDYARMKPSMPWFVLRGYQILSDLQWPEEDLPLSFPAHAAIEERIYSCLRGKHSPAAALKLLARDLSESGSGKSATPLVSQAIAFVADHLTQPLSVASIAQALGVDRSHFSRAFTRETGKNPVEYLQEARLARARLLLEKNEAPVTEVARQSGFADSKYFFRLFKSRTGQTPTEFRRELKRRK